MSSEWKVYTRTGDKGTTALIGGTRVPKYHERIEAYGTIDELNSYIGLIRDSVSNLELKDVLIEIQDRLFSVESLLASDSEAGAGKKLPPVYDDDVALLEKYIDKMNEQLPELKSFVLPGGSPLGSHCHIARCICRRAERIVIHVATKYEVDPICSKYLNRLSDYLFVLARKLTIDEGGKEIPWTPKVQ
ncbi:MAG: cob(I)yrinic acid a,c-diamide adenosyltransferase [Hyphomicrobiales bacterium]